MSNIKPGDILVLVHRTIDRKLIQVVRVAYTVKEKIYYGPLPIDPTKTQRIKIGDLVYDITPADIGKNIPGLILPFSITQGITLTPPSEIENNVYNRENLLHIRESDISTTEYVPLLNTTIHLNPPILRARLLVQGIVQEMLTVGGNVLGTDTTCTGWSEEKLELLLPVLPSSFTVKIQLHNPTNLATVAEAVLDYEIIMVRKITDRELARAALNKKIILGVDWKQTSILIYTLTSTDKEQLIRLLEKLYGELTEIRPTENT